MTKLAALFALSYLIFISLLVFLFKYPMFYFIYYSSASLITYHIYAKDKHASINDKWRVSEKLLHCFEIIGGWPGALLAVHSLRHKSQKKSFQFFLIMAVLINIIFFGFLIIILRNIFTGYIP